MKSASSHILVGTAKGLIVYDSHSELPSFSKVHFKGFSINMLYADERINRWWAGVSHKHWGQKLHFSDDLGGSWHEAKTPSFSGETMSNGKPAKLRQIWCMHHGGGDHPGRLWLGTDPGGLFMSEDNGENFKLVKGLWDHPSRQKEGQWFGAGSDFPFIHSIVVNPKDSNHVYIAVSCAGVFETKDGGENWQPKNNGLVAAYLPNPNVEVGHDPHLLLMSPKQTKVLWQQNHCGVFYTKDGGDSWEDASVKEGIPSYGFGIGIDEENPGRAWVIPVESDEQRVAPDLKLRVYETDDFGGNWFNVSEGLPTNPSFDIVLRQAFAVSEDHMIFGTTNGNLYYSKKNNIRWSLLNSNLTKVNTVIFT